MTLLLNYKGFAFEDAIEHQPPDRSVELAVGTYYHIWFEVLKRSPWYLKHIETGNGGDFYSHRVVEKFGDVRNVDFKAWWLTTGYLLFREIVPYQAVQPVSVQPIRPTRLSKDQKRQNALQLSLPLNLAKQEVLRQVERAFEIAQEDLQRRISQNRENANAADGYNRHVFGTAEVYLYDDNRLNPSTIWENLKFFSRYVEERKKRGKSYKQYEFAVDQGLVGKITRDAPWKPKASNAVSDKLKGIYYLMHHASHGKFPCNDEIKSLHLTDVDAEFFSPEGDFMFGEISKVKANEKWPKPKSGRSLDAE